MQDKNDVDRLCSIVKSARQAKGRTQSQLAERLGITVRYFKAIENSGKKPNYDLLVECGKSPYHSRLRHKHFFMIAGRFSIFIEVYNITSIFFVYHFLSKTGEFPVPDFQLSLYFFSNTILSIPYTPYLEKIP